MTVNSSGSQKVCSLSLATCSLSLATCDRETLAAQFQPWERAAPPGDGRAGAWVGVAWGVSGPPRWWGSRSEEGSEVDGKEKLRHLDLRNIWNRSS